MLRNYARCLHWKGIEHWCDVFIPIDSVLREFITTVQEYNLQTRTSYSPKCIEMDNGKYREENIYQSPTRGGARGIIVNYLQLEWDNNQSALYLLGLVYAKSSISLSWFIDLEQTAKVLHSCTTIRFNFVIGNENIFLEFPQTTIE